MHRVSILLLILFGVFANGGLIPHSEVEDFNYFPQYRYGYSVHDPITGDIKSQEESRHGEVVSGSYSLLEPNGEIRTVVYHADSTGFHATVERYPGGGRPSVPAPIAPSQVQVPFRPTLPFVEPPPTYPIEIVERPVHSQPPETVISHPVQPIPSEPAFQPIQQEPVHAPVEPQPVIPPVQQPEPVIPPVQDLQPVISPVQPEPVEPPVQPTPQPIPQPIPQPPQPAPILPPRPTPPSTVQQTFDDAEVIEARRADLRTSSGSLGSYRSSRNGQHNFSFSY